MKIDSLTPSKQVLAEMGSRLAKARKQRRMSQDVLAEEAGIGVATLRRIEAGSDSQFESWIKILKALGMSASIDSILPEQSKSPMEEVLRTKRRRNKNNKTRMWGDEAK